jgi:UTP:GlnB (protein PII) uridylyltransferase
LSSAFQALEDNDFLVPSLSGAFGLMPSEQHTCIELTGTNSPGLLSEVCAVLAGLHCNIVNAEIWTHNARAAVVVHVIDDATCYAIEDSKHLATIKDTI